MRVRIQSYGNGKSKSARNLAEYLGLKRIRVQNSRFRARPTDILINWGNVGTQHQRGRYLNSLDAVAIASNKLETFKMLSEFEIPVPEFTTEKPEEGKWVARTQLSSHSGQGAVVAVADELPHAPLYTKYIEKDAEYRAIVVGGEVVDIKQKKRKSDFPEDQRQPYIWAHDNGYVFCRQDITYPDDLKSIAIKSLDAINLTYGAVDLIVKDEQVYVLEINSAFGIENSTVRFVGEAIKRIINEKVGFTKFQLDQEHLS